MSPGLEEWNGNFLSTHSGMFLIWCVNHASPWQPTNSHVVSKFLSFITAAAVAIYSHYIDKKFLSLQYLAPYTYRRHWRISPSVIVSNSSDYNGLSQINQYGSERKRKGIRSSRMIITEIQLCWAVYSIADAKNSKTVHVPSYLLYKIDKYGLHIVPSFSSIYAQVRCHSHRKTRWRVQYRRKFRKIRPLATDSGCRASVNEKSSR